MQCPRCDISLNIEIHKGMEVDRCKQCDGIWLDHHELDQLEDTIFEKDALKGKKQYNLRPSDIKCPVCSADMNTFNYMAYHLPNDTCEEEQDYWLHNTQHKQVIPINKQRKKY